MDFAYLSLDFFFISSCKLLLSDILPSGIIITIPVGRGKQLFCLLLESFSYKSLSKVICVKYQTRLNEVNKSIMILAGPLVSGCLVHVILVLRNHTSRFQRDAVNCGGSADFQTTTQMAELWMVASVTVSPQKSPIWNVGQLEFLLCLMLENLVTYLQLCFGIVTVRGCHLSVLTGCQALNR